MLVRENSRILSRGKFERVNHQFVRITAYTIDLILLIIKSMAYTIKSSESVHVSPEAVDFSLKSA